MKFVLSTKISALCVQLVIIGFGIVFLNACTNTGEGVNPGLVDTPLVYTKRTIPVENDGMPTQYDVADPLLFSGGGDLYIRTTTSSSVAERNITRSITNGVGDVKDVSANYAGDKVIFSLRLEDPDPNDTDIPKWQIYEYDVTNDQVRPVITADPLPGNDVSPSYLPDGRIVFSSDRQVGARAVLGIESPIGISKTGFSARGEDRGIKALVLHVMDADGGNIHQITYNQSHDLDPVVMPNGRILFSRWDHAGNNNLINLYTVKPDGTDLQIYYGDHASSHRDAHNDVVQFTKPQIMQDGRVLVLARAFTDTYGGGDLLLIDGENYIDINQPTYTNQNILSGPGQAKATVTNVSARPVTDSGSSTAGRYAAAFPLRDGSNRLIVSKGVCQVTTDDPTDPAVVVQLHPCVEPYLSAQFALEMPSAYGLWIYNLSNNTERPLIAAEPGYMLTDVVVLQPYERQAVIEDSVLTGVDAALAAQNLGLLNIRSVYDMGNGTFTCAFFTVTCTQNSLQALSDLSLPADQRPARFLRLVKPVGIPVRNDPELVTPDIRNTELGRSPQLGMREIIGYSQIEPDGSVKVKVPANVAFGVEVLDKYGRRIGPRHDSWLQVKPGESLSCNGCHAVPAAPALPKPHGRAGAEAPSINPGVLGGNISGSTIPNNGLPYLGYFGETLAEVRSRTDATALDPSVDIKFSDNWVTPPVDTSFRYTYADHPASLDAGVPVYPFYPVSIGLTTVSPISSAASCQTAWQAGCRTVINYKKHIQPLWVLSRGVTGANTCINCHNTVDPLNANAIQVPAGQLDLTGGASVDEPKQIVSYRNLLFTHDQLQLVNGALDFILVDDPNSPILDPITGLPVEPPQFNQIPATSQPSMSTVGARASYFMEKMTDTELNAARSLSGSTNHAGFLTDAELRLISEWLDLGGQYYNNPFDPDLLP